MENLPPQHAELHVNVSRHSDPSAFVAAIVTVSGCKECLVKALTQVLLHDSKFKELINTAVRAANEIRARNQN